MPHELPNGNYAVMYSDGIFENINTSGLNWLGLIHEITRMHREVIPRRTVSCLYFNGTPILAKYAGIECMEIYQKHTKFIEEQAEKWKEDSRPLWVPLDGPTGG